MSSSNHNSDDIDDLIFGNDDNNNIIDNNEESLKKLLNKNLLNYINTGVNLNNNYPMESTSKSKSKSDKSIDSSYFDKNEQINEVKINIFYILSLDFRLNKDSSYNYYTFLTNKNEIKTHRLVIQKFHLKNKQIYYQDKEYIFLPALIISPEINFKYNGKNIICYYDKENNNKFNMKLDDKLLLDKKEFIESFKDPEIINIIKQNEIDKEKDRKNIDEKSEEENNKSSTSKELNLSYMTKSDDSEKETEGERFYKINEENEYIRFFYQKYKKEIDGFYNMHKSINLNKDNIITLKEGLDNLKVNYDDKNDLKCGIIYKNFKESIIDKNEPVILEVKKGFRLIDLFNQIKQNSKPFHNLYTDKKIKLPKYAIGIICSDYNDDYKDQIKKLNDPYNNDSKCSYLDHISKVFEKNDFNVIIGVFKNPKILEYPLDIEDWKIEGENLTKRVDLEYMNKVTCVNKKKEDLDTIVALFKKKFKSLIYDGTISIGEHKKKLEEKNKLIESQKDLLNNIQNEITKFDNKEAGIQKRI